MRGEFSHTVRLYFMRVVVNEAFFRIFKQSEGSKKQPKIFSGTSDFLRIFDKKQKQNTIMKNFPHFFSLVLGRCFGKVCVVVTASATIILP